MKKFVNDGVNVVPEALRGFGRAHRGLVVVHEKPAYVTRASPKSAKVALVSGGGSGQRSLQPIVLDLLALDVELAAGRGDERQQLGARVLRAHHQARARG